MFYKNKCPTLCDPPRNVVAANLVPRCPWVSSGLFLPPPTRATTALTCEERRWQLGSNGVLACGGAVGRGSGVGVVPGSRLTTR